MSSRVVSASDLVPEPPSQMAEGQNSERPGADIQTARTVGQSWAALLWGSKNNIDHTVIVHTLLKLTGWTVAKNLSEIPRLGTEKCTKKKTDLKLQSNLKWLLWVLWWLHCCFSKIYSFIGVYSRSVLTETPVAGGVLAAVLFTQTSSLQAARQDGIIAGHADQRAFPRLQDSLFRSAGVRKIAPLQYSYNIDDSLRLFLWLHVSQRSTATFPMMHKASAGCDLFLAINCWFDDLMKAALFYWSFKSIWHCRSLPALTEAT